MYEHPGSTPYSSVVPPSLIADFGAFPPGILAAFPINLAVLDENGVILALNRSCCDNEAGNDPQDLANSIGQSYFAACEMKMGIDTEFAQAACAGLHQILSEERSSFTLEYPCHSSNQRRWHLMRASGFRTNGKRYAVVMHEDITRRVLAEEHARLLARFPSENPNPVMQITTDGQVVYANDASVLLLTAWGRDADGKLLEPWNERLRSANRLGQVTQFEYVCGERTFRLELVPIPTSGCINIYGYDITEYKRADDDLRRSESTLKQAQRIARVGSWQWNVQSNRLEWSDEMYHIFDIDKASFTGDLSLVIAHSVHPDDRAALEEANRVLIEDGKLIPLEYRVVVSDGSERVVWAEADELVRDSAGQPAIVMGIVKDITERRHIEQSLRESEERFRAVFEHSSLGKALTALDGRLLKVNRAFANLLGYTIEEMQQVDFTRITHPLDIAQSRECLRCLLANEQNQCRMEKRYVHKNGTAIWTDVNISLLRDAAGSPLSFITSVADITERKQAEETLRREKELYERLLQTLSDLGVGFTVREGNRLAFANGAFCAMMGYSQEELYALPSPMALVPPDERAGLVSRIPGSAVNNTFEGHFETVMLRKNGDRIYLDVSVKNLLVGDLLQQIVVIRDVSQRKLAEAEVRQLNMELEQRVLERTAQLEAANKELEAFTYSVSHDLRSPLRAIDGFSRILVRDYQALLPEEGQRRLQLVRTNTQQMGELIDDLLAFSRLSRQPPVKQSVDLVRLVRQVLEELSSERENRQVEILVADLPGCEADPTLLRQVYVNLLSNALKFTRQREAARVEIGCDLLESQPVYFVKDNGVGFDMRYADKLFGVFQRLHRADEYEGTGVGLAIVQRIVHRHGGRVWAESVVDKGTAFYFTLADGKLDD